MRKLFTWFICFHMILFLHTINLFSHIIFLCIIHLCSHMIFLHIIQVFTGDGSSLLYFHVILSFHMIHLFSRNFSSHDSYFRHDCVKWFSHMITYYSHNYTKNIWSHVMVYMIFLYGILNSVPECFLYPTWQDSCIMRLQVLICWVENLSDVEELKPREDEMRIRETDWVESHS